MRSVSATYQHRPCHLVPPTNTDRAPNRFGKSIWFACRFGKSIRMQINSANQFGKSIRQIDSANRFGKFTVWINLANRFGKSIRQIESQIKSFFPAWKHHTIHINLLICVWSFILLDTQFKYTLLLKFLYLWRVILSQHLVCFGPCNLAAGGKLL